MKSLEQLGKLTPEEIEIAVSAVKLYRLNKSVNKQKLLKL